MFNLLLDILVKYESSLTYKQLKKKLSIGQKKYVTVLIN